METTLDKAYSAYMARKQVERQLKLIELQQEIVASMAGRAVAGRGYSARKHTPLVGTAAYVAPAKQPTA
ncbi:hypothetical protein [Hymenobacter sp. IS2118]|uniref:hypothetical protein n=1 Tax=Hymenobacter sp. IS2118 TaxID=1505605 RepID=UPI000552CF0F|nr:hypothetical protein [Hymenobacter sp. IS2118]